MNNYISLMKYYIMVLQLALTVDQQNVIIFFVKNPSQRTQKRMTCLDFQLALRNYETYLINAAFEYMNQDNLDENEEYFSQEKLKSTKGNLKLKIIDETKMAFYEQNSMKIPDDVLNFIVNEYEPIQESINSEEYIELKYFSEYKRNNKIFRAHPNYKQEGK